MSLTHASLGAQPRWRTVYVVVVAGCLISLLSFGVRAGFGLFVAPISESQGWGREAFALSIALQNLIWGAGQPFAGAIADKFGPARVLAGGGILYALGVAMMAVVTTPTGMHLSAGLLVGLGLSGCAFPVVLAGFARLLPAEKRSWAMGLGTAAGSMGQFLLVPLGQGFILAYGWPTALLLLAGGMLLVPFLATALSGAGAGGASGTALPMSFREALGIAFGHSSYRLLIAGFFVCGFHVAFITVHLPPYLIDIGAGPQLGAWAIAIVGLANIVGSYGAGMLGSRYSKRWLLSAIYFGRAVAITIFLVLPPTAPVVLGFAFCMGILWLSTVPLTSGLVMVMFGTRFMATLFGVVFFSHQVGSFLGIWLGGFFYEHYGSYDPVWWMGIGLGLFAALIHLPIVERRAPAFAALPA